ncbi:MAG: stage II sporulation protein M [Candidatus Altiarchaeota archaeon]
MVLEAIVVPESWEKHPKRMLIIGFTYATVGIFLALWAFGKYASISGIFLTTIPLVVIMYRALICEEAKDLKECREYVLIKEHLHILWFFLYLFVGMVLAYAFWYTILPTSISDKVCSSQIETIRSIQSQFTPTGATVSNMGNVQAILANNLRVLSFCIIFSLIYGAGAIFILCWNASVIGVAIGNVIREGFNALGEYGHNPTLIHYFNVIPLGLVYLVHGVPEVAGYFLGSLAGGIISVAVVCHHYRSKEFWHIVADSVDLILLSLIILVIAALTEVYVTPALL